MKKQINIIRSLALAALIAAGAATPAVNASAQIEHVGVRTNALTWMMLSPSLGADVQFGGRWQAGIDGHVSLIGATDDMVKMTGAGAELRRYFCKAYTSTDIREKNGGAGRSYHGLYMGISARYLKYDDRLLNKPSRDGKMMTAGLLAGYTFLLPGHWTVDASIGVGYVHDDYTAYEWYQPRQVNRWIESEVRNRFGLTSAEISLVYNFNIGKKTSKH